MGRVGGSASRRRWLAVARAADPALTAAECGGTRGKKKSREMKI